MPSSVRPCSRPRARGWEVFGIRRGYSGLFQAGYGGVVVLDEAAVRGITHEGGTILGTTSRGNPFSFQVTQPDGSVRTVDRSGEVIDRFREMGIDCLIAIGGDGSLRIARDLARRGLNVIGVPKTIDNDLGRNGGDLRLPYRRPDRDRRHRQASFHRRGARARHGGRADGTARRLDRALRRPGRGRGRDSHPGDPLPARPCGGSDRGPLEPGA